MRARRADARGDATSRPVAPGKTVHATPDADKRRADADDGPRTTTTTTTTTTEQLAALPCQAKLRDSPFPTTFSPFLSRDDAITPRELCVAALLFPLACARAVALVAHLVAFAAISKLKLLGLPRDVQRGDAPTPRWRETLFYLAFRALMTSCLLSVGVLVRVRGRDEIRRVLYTGPHTTAFAR